MLVYYKLLPIKLLTSPRSSMVKKLHSRVDKGSQGEQCLALKSQPRFVIALLNLQSGAQTTCQQSFLHRFDPFIPIASNFCTNSNWLKMALTQSENFNFSVIFNRKRNLRRPVWIIFTMKCEVYTNSHWMNVSIRRFPFCHFYCGYS